MIEKIDGFEINLNEKSKRIINIDISEYSIKLFNFLKFCKLIHYCLLVLSIYS